MMAGYSETLDVRYMTPYPRRPSGACDVGSDVTLSSSHQLPLQCGAAMHQGRTVPRRSSSYRSSGDDDDDDDDDEDGDEGEDGGDRYPGTLPSRDCRGGRGRYRGGYAQRSEWVTLSKTILMQLVERICQLSFQGDMQPFGSSSVSDFDPCAERHEYRDREPIGWSLPTTVPTQSLRPPSSHQQCTSRTDTTQPTSVAGSSSGCSAPCDILAQTPPPALCSPPQQLPCINPLLPPAVPRASRRNRIVRPWSEDEDLPVSVTQQQQQQPLPALPLLSATSSHSVTLPLTSSSHNITLLAVTSQNTTLSVTAQNAALPPSENHVTGSSPTFASRNCALEINKNTPSSETMDNNDDDDVFKSSSVNIVTHTSQPCDAGKENVLEAACAPVVTKVPGDPRGQREHLVGQNLVTSRCLGPSFTPDAASLSIPEHHRVIVQNEKNSLIHLLSDSNADHGGSQSLCVTPDHGSRDVIKPSRDVTRTINETSLGASEMSIARTCKTVDSYNHDAKPDARKYGVRKSKKFTNDDFSRYPDAVGYPGLTAAGRARGRKRRAQGVLGGEAGGDEGRLLNGGIQLYLVNKRLCDENTTMRRSEHRSNSSDPQHSSRQSWVALNKSLVYGMIDSALAAQSDVKRKQQKHHQRAAHKERIMTSRNARESAHGKRFTLTAQEIGKRDTARDEGGDASNAQDIVTKVHDADTRAYVDVNVSNSTVSTEMEVTPATLSDVNTNVTRKTQFSDISTVPLAAPDQKKSNKIRSRSGKTFIELQDTEKLFGRNNNNNNNNVGGYDAIDSLRVRSDCDDKDNCNDGYVCRELVLQTHNSTDDIDVCTHDADHELENEPLLRGNRTRGVQRTHKRATSVIALQGGGMDVRRTLGGSYEGVSPTPRWIALDKSQVCSLVESLVSTMMMLDDPIQRLPAAQSGLQSLTALESQPGADNVTPTMKQTTNTSPSGDSSINNFTGDARESSPTMSRNLLPYGKSLQFISDVNVDEFQQLVPPRMLDESPPGSGVTTDESPSSGVTTDVPVDQGEAEDAAVVLEGSEKPSLEQSRRQAIKWKSSMLLRMRSEHVLKVTTATSSQSH